MKTFLTLILFAASVIAQGQELSSVPSIDSLVFKIENDQPLTKKIWDTTRYEKEDGGDRWDSAYIHIEYFFKNGQVVKILSWNRYQDWRNDMIGYYHNGKVIAFLQGEGMKGTDNYGKLNFQIYYYQDKGINVSWITPKPTNVLSVATDTYLIWAYNLLAEKGKHNLK
jgi:hypothetical protein